MRRPRALVAVALAFAGLIPVGCGGDDEQVTTSPTPEAPSGDAAPASPGGLPPEFRNCMAEQGFPIESPTEIHSAPQQVLQECFGAFHGGGGGP